MRAALLLASLAVLAGLPSGEANAHNAAWRGEGPAVASSGQVFLLEVVWHGACTSYFTATLRDSSTGAVLEQRDFAGGQFVVELPVPAVALGPEAFLVFSTSLDPQVEFAVQGAQAFTHEGASTESQVVQGVYRGLRVALLTTVAPWGFC